MEEALQQRRRAQIAQRFLSGEWGLQLESWRNAAAQGFDPLAAQSLADLLHARHRHASPRWAEVLSSSDRLGSRVGIEVAASG